MSGQLNRRGFLSPDKHSSAHFHTEFFGACGGMKIADCGRSICLELNADTPTQRRQTIRKLNNLIRELEIAREAVEEHSP